MTENAAIRDLDCTVLMFTYERPYHLARAISYWEKSGVKVIIADGSKYPCDNIPESIEYMHRPGASIMQRIFELSNRVKTKFAVFVADDDFLGYEGLEIAVTFLNKNPDYASAQGLYTQYRITKPFNKIVTRPAGTCFANHYNWSSDDYVTRLRDINSYKIMHYCYSVVTKEVLDTLYSLFQGIEVVKGDTLFEPLMAYSIAINGKIKTLQSFYCARESVESPDWLGIMSFEKFVEENSAEYRRLIDNVAAECTKKYGTEHHEAIAAAEMAGITYHDSMRKRMETANTKNNDFNVFNIINEMINKVIVPIKLLLQNIGLTSTRGIDSKFFSENVDALIAYKHDWEKIKLCIYKSEETKGDSKGG